MEINPFNKKQNGPEKKEMGQNFLAKEIETHKNDFAFLIQKIRQQFPSLERIIQSPGKIVKLLSVVVLMEGGQLFAKNLPTKDINKTLPETPSLASLTNLIFHINLEEKNGKVTKETSGDIADTASFENVTVSVSIKKIDGEKRNGKKFIRDNYFSENITISKDTVVKENSENRKEKTVSATGHTRKEALANAMAKLAEQREVLITAITEKSDTERSGNFNETIREETSQHFKTISIIGIKLLQNGLYEASVSGE